MDFINSLVSAPFVCIGWLIVGAIAGALARTIMGRRDSPILMDIVLGIAGAIIGGFVAGLLGVGPKPTDSGLGLVVVNLVIATVGAVILLALGRIFMRRAV
jgi:uncharacterized membrane protein YeaQ/YmgE (transglycosylase-associated protein family)